LSQAELASFLTDWSDGEISPSQSTVSAWERGAVTPDATSRKWIEIFTSIMGGKYIDVEKNLVWTIDLDRYRRRRRKHHRRPNGD